MKPSVTIIIPTYKATSRLRTAINSVLNQNYNNLQIIVVDDNDPESKHRLFTEQLMCEFSNYPNLCYIQHEFNMNGASARNTGLQLSNSEFIGFLDDDDEYYPNRIEKSVDSLIANPYYDAIYTNVDIFIDDIYQYTKFATVSGYVWKELLLNEGLLGSGSNIFFKRSCLEDVVEFDNRFIRYQDVEFMLRLTQKHKLLALNDSLVKKNIENTNIPPYLDYHSNKELIFSKFSNLINQLSEEERVVFFSSQYSTLLKSAIHSKNYSYISIAKRELSRYKTIDTSTRFKCLLPHLYIKYLEYFN